MFLPKKIRTKILQLWDRRDPNVDCRQQQRKTRYLILLNLHPSLMRVVRPPALRCSLPHFIDRLESDLQQIVPRSVFEDSSIGSYIGRPPRVIVKARYA
ncbi:unnamed protein product [Angiostrongylus costaricensis]|uniref:Uncharacterized protein n=1 Tax=Angiostrongylus costaricensis TaxID=334426 RepID=A0A0R3PAL1_ANGCS|nr:unnamed protein product [Angiostrongylus costaricensis]